MHREVYTLSRSTISTKASEHKTFVPKQNGRKPSLIMGDYELREKITKRPISRKLDVFWEGRSKKSDRFLRAWVAFLPKPIEQKWLFYETKATQSVNEYLRRWPIRKNAKIMIFKWSRPIFVYDFGKQQEDFDVRAASGARKNKTEMKLLNQMVCIPLMIRRVEAGIERVWKYSISSEMDYIFEPKNGRKR